MNTLANMIAINIKKADPDRTHSIEIMEYSLSILINTALIIVTSLCIGWAIGLLKPTAITLLSFAILRFASGGIHLKSAWKCNIVSISICIFIPYFSSQYHLPIHLINLFSLIIMVLFAPRPDDNTQMPIQLLPILKIISIFLVCSNFIIASDVIGLAFLFQSLTVIPLGKEVSHD